VTRSIAAPETSGQRSSLDDVIDAFKRGVDRTLLREALGMTPDERLRAMVALVAFGDELRKAGKKTFG
jgi:hypothetical protein